MFQIIALCIYYMVSLNNKKWGLSGSMPLDKYLYSWVWMNCYNNTVARHFSQSFLTILTLYSHICICFTIFECLHVHTIACNSISCEASYTFTSITTDRIITSSIEMTVICSLYTFIHICKCVLKDDINTCIILVKKAAGALSTGSLHKIFQLSQKYIFHYNYVYKYIYMNIYIFINLYIYKNIYL